MHPLSCSTYFQGILKKEFLAAYKVGSKDFYRTPILSDLAACPGGFGLYLCNPPVLGRGDSLMHLNHLLRSYTSKYEFVYF